MTHSEKEARQDLLIELFKENDQKRAQVTRQKDERLLKLVEEEDAMLTREWQKLEAEPVDEFTDSGKTMFPDEEREVRF